MRGGNGELKDCIGEQLILEHAISCGLSAYDATYLTLAETCGADLFTADGDLLRLATRHSFIKDIRKFNSNV